MEQTCKWISRSGLKIRGVDWSDESTPKAVIVLVHGQGEHIGRYQHLATFFNERGMAVIGADLPGHGLSEGKRGHINEYEDYLEIVDLLSDYALKKWPQQPQFIYGHSMGGNIVVNYVLRGRAKPIVRGAIVTGAWLQLAFEPPAFKVKLASFMKNIYPKWTDRNGLDVNDISRDLKEVQAYSDDPLVHDKITAGAFIDIYQAGLWAMSRARELQLPVLLMHGASDKITSAEASRQFAEKAGEKASYKAWEGGYHEIHNDPNKLEVFEYEHSWMEKQLRVASV